MPDSKIKALPQSITTPENQPTRKGKGHAPKARSDSSIARQRFMAEVALDAANSLRFLAVDRSMNDYVRYSVFQSYVLYSLLTVQEPNPTPSGLSGGVA